MVVGGEGGAVLFGCLVVRVFDLVLCQDLVLVLVLCVVFFFRASLLLVRSPTYLADGLDEVEVVDGRRLKGDGGWGVENDERMNRTVCPVFFFFGVCVGWPISDQMKTPPPSPHRTTTHCCCLPFPPHRPYLPG